MNVVWIWSCDTYLYIGSCETILNIRKIPMLWMISIQRGIQLNLRMFKVKKKKRIGGVMVSVLASSAVDCGFESRSGQTKDYNIGICSFSAKHTELRRKSKDWLARYQDNASE
jgi:hypothetical protein